jgi:uncharacterized membrane protein
MKMEEEMKITKIIAEKTNMNIGALPDLSLLKQYELIQPGLGDRYLSMFEMEAKHRHELNEKICIGELEIVNQRIRNFKRGQNFAFLSIVLVVALSALALYFGYSTVARDIAVVVIVALASVFMGKGLQGKRTSDSSKEN